jgi:predicted small metal-binding protein
MIAAGSVWPSMAPVRDGAAAFSLRASSHGFSAWSGSCGALGRGGFRSLGNARVFFYRQHKPDGKVVEAYWLTNFPCSTVGPQALFRMAKSRWEIENQGFNDAKSRHGLEHICHHHANSLLIGWLLTMLALTIERLYRLRVSPSW